MFLRKSNKYLSVEEAATILGKSAGQIELYIWLNRIQNAQKTGNSYNIPKEEVYRLQDEQEESFRKQERSQMPVETTDNESFSFM